MGGGEHMPRSNKSARALEAIIPNTSNGTVWIVGVLVPASGIRGTVRIIGR